MYSLFKGIHEKQKNIDFGLWIVIAVYRVLFYSSLIPYKTFADSYEYTHFPFRLFFLTSSAENGRTFIYPLLIRIFFYIFGETYYLTAVVWFQIIVSFIAVIYFKKIIEMFIDNRLIARLIVVLYAVNSSIIGWDKAILTESLACSVLIITMYFVFMYLKTWDAKWGMFSIIWAFIGTFIRPSSLIYFIILSLFYILYQIVKKLWNLKLNITLVILWSFLLGYCLFFQAKFGIFSLTNAIPRQQLIVVMEKQYYKSSSNPEFVDMIDQKYEEKNGDTWAAMWEVLDYYGNSKILRYAKECIRLNKNLYILDRLNQMGLEAKSDFIEYYLEYKHPEADSLFLSIQSLIDRSSRTFNAGSAYVFVILSGFVLAFLSFQRKRISWIALGMFGFSTGTVLVSFLGTCGEYARTMICVLPIIYLGLSWGIGGFKELDNRQSFYQS